MDKRFWAIIGVIVVIFGGIFYYNSKANKQEASQSNVQATNHVRGKADAKVTLVEYGDFECPVCGAYYPTLRLLEQKYPDNLKFQFRHFPLTSIHQNALAGSRAAEAAGMQGKFFEMYDQLYTNQDAWSTSQNTGPIFTGYAKAIGLNTDQFTKDIASSSVNNAINADRAAGEKLNISATPSFFLNGKPVPLETLVDNKTKQPSVDKFSQAIDSALKQAGK